MQLDLQQAIGQTLDLQQQKLLQIQTSDSSLELSGLAEAYYGLADAFSSCNQQGISDALALYAELLEQIDRQSGFEAVLLQSAAAAQKLLSTDTPTRWVDLLECLADSRWPSAIAYEDLSFLAELLPEECQQVAPASVATDHSDTAVTAPSQAIAETTTGSAAPGQAETATSSLANPVEDSSESATDSGESQPPATEQRNTEATEAVTQLRQLLATSLPENPVEALTPLIDRFSEVDLHGVADLLALSGELLSEQIESDDGDIGPLLQQQLLALCSAPDISHGVAVLDLLGDSRWTQPVAAVDIEFLQDLLLENCEFLQTLPVTEITLTGEATATDGTLEAAQDKTLAAAECPLFGPIAPGLLEEEGPILDPAAIEMLASTIQSLKQQWDSAAASAEPMDFASKESTLTPVLRAAETLRLSGTAVILDGLQKNLHYFTASSTEVSEAQQQALSDTLDTLGSYLLDVSEKQRRQNLLDIVCDSPLPVRPDSAQSALLIGLLALPSVQQSSAIQRQYADNDAISLVREGDIDPQLLDMLYNELPQLSDELLNQLQQITEGQQLEALGEAQRTAHTIKGLANMAGIAGIANLTHNLEDILEILSDEASLPQGVLAQDLLQAADCLAAATESITESGTPPEDLLGVLQRLMDWHYQLRSGEQIIEEQQAIIAEPSAPARSAAEELPNAEEESDAATPAEKRDSDSFRVSRQLLDNLFRIAGENSTLTAQLDEELTQLRALTRSGRERQRAMQRVMFELEQQLNEHFTLSPAVQQEDEEFDPLEMDRYNEMHTTLARLHEVATDVAEVGQGVDGHVRNLSELHVAQSGLQKEALNTVLSTRLVEVNTISTRLQRILRQACRLTGKQARLSIIGGDTRIDSQILNQLTDPLMHMIRNAVDHGLETEHGRFEAGKATEGEIKLSFSQDNDLIRIRLEDDGNGFNLEAIRDSAIGKTLLSPEQQPSEAELLRLVLIPGFSTSESVSQLSGRGIGLDVVNQQITRMQGTLELGTDSGRGSHFDITLPASSLMIKTLLVRAGKQVFALVSHGIEQSLLSIDGEYVQDSDGAKFVTAEQTYPAVSLEELVSTRQYGYHNSGVHPVLLVKTSSGETIALLVREVIAHRELVFKAMGDFVPDIPGIPGLTILANGEVAPVVDLPGRIRHYQDNERGLQTLPELEFETELPSIVVVDDSISARKSLETLLQDTGYEVRTAIDGLDALNQIRKQPPQIVLTDLEMPRMNGIELTSSLRSKAETRDIPVIMISSRSTLKHREEAEQAGINAYINKPWTENDLLDLIQVLLTKNKNKPE